MSRVAAFRCHNHRDRTVDEEKVLLVAQRESNLAIRRVGLQRWSDVPEGFWGKTRLLDEKAQ
jgi:hypothetical protein